LPFLKPFFSLTIDDFFCSPFIAVLFSSVDLQEITWSFHLFSSCPRSVLASVLLPTYGSPFFAFSFPSSPFLYLVVLSSLPFPLASMTVLNLFTFPFLSPPFVSARPSLFAICDVSFSTGACVVCLVGRCSFWSPFVFLLENPGAFSPPHRPLLVNDASTPDPQYYPSV